MDTFDKCNQKQIKNTNEKMQGNISERNNGKVEHSRKSGYSLVYIHTHT